MLERIIIKLQLKYFKAKLTRLESKIDKNKRKLIKIKSNRRNENERY